MGYAETLLLIYDQQSQILKLHVLRQDPVGSDDHIHLTFFQILDGLFLLGRSAETAEKFHTYRKFLHPLGKCIINLLRQNGSRGKICHLSALLHSFKCSTQSYFRFSVSHISADQTVHDLRTLHIPLGILDGTELILCFLIREHFLELLLPYRIRSADISLFLLPCGIKFHQVLRNILYRSPDFAFGLVPFLGA